MGVLPVNANVNLDLTESVNNATETALTPAKGSSKWAGKLLDALFGPWLAAREGKRKCIEAYFEKVAQDIKDGQQLMKPGIITPISEMPTLGDACKMIVQTNTDCKAKRLEYAMREVAAEMRSIPDEDISGEPLNQTFFNHWREEAELIDDDDLRKLWANLLVEETCKPNSISPRTLSVVKNLSRQDAEAFERLCQLLFATNSIIISQRGIPLNGTYQDVLLLQDAGLISQASNGHLIPDSEEPFDGKFQENDHYFLKVDKTKQIDYYCHLLTTAGLQIVKFVKQKDELFNIKILAKELSKQNRNIIIHLHQKTDGIPDDQAPEIWNTTQEI